MKKKKVEKAEEKKKEIKYTVRVKTQAEKALARLPKNIQKRVRDAINGLETDPRPFGAEKLEDSDGDFYRIRFGDYRMVYEVLEKVVTVLILRIGHRKDVYRNL